MRILVNEQFINELGIDTLHGASERMRNKNQLGRLKKMNATYFHKFIGREFLNGTISHVEVYGDNPKLKIQINNDNNTEVDYIFYMLNNPLKDAAWVSDKKGWTAKNGNILEYPMSRKDALFFIKLIKSINPNTTYGSVNDFTIKEYQ